MEQTSKGSFTFNKRRSEFNRLKRSPYFVTMSKKPKPSRSHSLSVNNSKDPNQSKLNLNNLLDKELSKNNKGDKKVFKRFNKFEKYHNE